MQKICLENVSENEHKDFLFCLERLVNLPFSYRLVPHSYLYPIRIHHCNSLICRVRDDIFSWRVKEEDSAAGKDFVTPQFDEKGRAWVEVEGRRKTSRATVRISKPGTGQV